MARQAQQIILSFPSKGTNVVVPRSEQPLDTSFKVKNVRLFDQLEGRSRGGIRPGLSKYNATQIDGANRIQCIDYATVIANSAPATGSLGVRTIRSVAVSNGTIATFDDVNTINTATVSGSRTLSNTAPFILSAELFGRVYFTDGISYKIWVGSNNSANDWTATAGALPGTDGTRVPRLIEMWRSRIWLSGLASDPHNYFFSALGDPLDFDTSPDVIVETQAFAGGVGVVGKVGQVINAGCPFSDDFFILFADASIWAMTGDPMAGGRVDMISDTIGGAFGRPWCRDTAGGVHFFGTRGGIYTISGPGRAPESITRDSIEPELADINLNTHFVRMAYDERQHGFYVFITPFSTGATEHWFYDMRSKGWFRDVFGNNNHNPMAVRVFDGDDPDDRVVLVGSEDGYIRQIDSSVSDDDGTDIESYAIIGPIKTEERTPYVLAELQADIDVNSSSVKYEVLAGETAEDAANDENGTFSGDGTFAAGRSVTHNPRRRAYYSYVKIGNTASATSWSMEGVRAKISAIPTSKVRSLF